MTQRTCLLLPLLLLATLASAQIEFGIKGGLSTTSLQDREFSFNRAGSEDLRLALENADYGYQLGVLLRIPLGEKWLIQPEATFNSSEATFRFDDDNNGVGEAFSERYNDLTVPVLFSRKLAFFRVNAGPVGHFRVDGPSDLRDREGIDRAWETLNLGYALGISLDIGPLTADVRYDGSFAEYGESFDFRGTEIDIDQAPKRWVGTVAWRF